MNSIWLSLLWKEWCEFRWKLVALVPILGVVPLLTFWGFADQRGGDKVLILTVLPAMSIIPYVVIAGLFVAMSVAAGESSRRTMRFLQATPIPMWKAALIKLLTAIVTVIVPIFIVVGVVWLIVNHHDPSGELQLQASRRLANEMYLYFQNPYVWQIVAGTLGATSLLLWGAAAGVNRSDEVRAGAIGFLIIAGLWFTFAFGVGVAERCVGTTLTDRAVLLFGALPGGPALVMRNIVMESTANLMIFSVVGVLSHAAVLTWFLRQFGRVAPPPKRGVAGNWNFAFWRTANPLPFGTPLGAIIWKQARDIGPLALIAVVGVVSFALLVYLWGKGQGGLRGFSEVLIALTVSVGILVTLVSGVGVLLEDYQPKVNTFWRSRPINPHLWFATKYLTGIIVLAAAFGPLPIALNWASGWRYASPQETLGVILFFVAVYTSSLTAYALVRQPVYAVILGIGFLWPLGLLDAGIAYELRERLGPELAATVAGGVLAIAYVAVVTLAWQAVVRDWGWKQHR